MNTAPASATTWIAAHVLLVAALVGLAIESAGAPFDQAGAQEMAPMGEVAMQQALGAPPDTQYALRPAQP